MSEDTKPQSDPAVEAELAGVPDELLDKETDKLGDALDRLRDDLEAAKQEVLYAKAETQNVRRRLEKDIADTRAYAAPAFRALVGTNHGIGPRTGQGLRPPRH